MTIKTQARNLTIGIDVRFAVRAQRRGIGNSIFHLVTHLASVDRENRYILYSDREDESRLLPQQDNFSFRVLRPKNHAIWEQSVLPRQVVRDGIDVLHCPGNTAPIWLDPNVALVVTINDVMYMKNGSLPKSPSPYQRLGRFYSKLVVSRVASADPFVVTISEFTRKDVLSHFPRLSNVEVVYLGGLDDDFSAGNKDYARTRIEHALGIADPIVLLLGGIDPRKNTDFAVENFVRWRAQSGAKEKLVVTGVQSGRFSRHDSAVVCLPFVANSQLKDLYAAAQAFIYPSLYEGFGIPPLEAMAAGTPVLASNRTSIPEVVGEAAALFDPANNLEFSSCLERVLRDLAYREVLIQSGYMRVRAFSWRQTAEQLLGVYRKAGSNRPTARHSSTTRNLANLAHGGSL